MACFAGLNVPQKNSTKNENQGQGHPRREGHGQRIEAEDPDLGQISSRQDGTNLGQGRGQGHLRNEEGQNLGQSHQGDGKDQSHRHITGEILSPILSIFLSSSSLMISS